MTPRFEQKWHQLAFHIGATVTVNLMFNSGFVAAEQGGGGDVHANRPAAGDWERLTMTRVGGSGALKHGDQVYINAPNGDYFAMQGTVIKAMAPDQASAELFTLEKVRGRGAVEVDEPLLLRASNDNIVAPGPVDPHRLSAAQSTPTAAALLTIDYIGGGENGPLGRRSTLGFVNPDFESTEPAQRHPIQEAHIREQLQQPGNTLTPEEINTPPVGNDSVPFGWDVLAFFYKERKFERPAGGWRESPVRVAAYNVPFPWALPRFNEPGQYKFPHTKTFLVYSDTDRIDVEIGQRFNVPGRPRLFPGSYKFKIDVHPRSWGEGGEGPDPTQDIAPTAPETSQVTLFAGPPDSRTEGPMQDAAAVPYKQWSTMPELEFEVKDGEEVWVGVQLQSEGDGLLRRGWYLDNAVLERVIPPGCDKDQTYHIFENGLIFEKLNGEQHALWGETLYRWQWLGWECDFLGAPITDQDTTDQARVNLAHFEGGSIYQVEDNAPQEIYDDFVPKWQQFGGSPALPILARLNTYDGNNLIFEDSIASKPEQVEVFVLEREVNTPLANGDTIFIRTLYHRYLSASGAQLTTNQPAGLPTTEEKFTLRKMNGDGNIYPGDLIAIQTHDGHYFSVGPTGLVELVSATGASIKEVFTFEFLGDGRPNALGYPLTFENETMTFEHGTLQKSLSDAPLTFFQQNMALLPNPAPQWQWDEGPYAGTDQTAAIDALIKYLCKDQPDIVGLSECFEAGFEDAKTWSRPAIKSRLRNVYPHFLEGPEEGNDFIPQNGGLLLLSKHPIVASQRSVYRQYHANTHEWSIRGMLHVRLAVADQGEFDVFLTQRPVGDGVTLTSQLDHLASFIHAHRNPDLPALLMGDLAIDAFSPLYERLTRGLRLGINLWNTDGSDGLTANHPANSFAPSLPPHARPDYFLIWPGDAVESVFDEVKTIGSIKTEAGVHISDHYGLLALQKKIKQWTVALSQTLPQTLTIQMSDFHCLTRTPGATDDQPAFRLSFNGQLDEGMSPIKIGNDGERSDVKDLNLPVSPTILPLSINLTGEDKNPITSGRFTDLPDEKLGDATFTVNEVDVALAGIRVGKKYSLMLQKPGPSILQRDAGEYVIEIEVK